MSLIPTGGVASGSPTFFNAVVPDSEERIEDLLLPDVSSTSNVLSNIAFYFNEGFAASTDGSKMIGITAGGVEVAIPSGQSDRVHVLAPGSSVSVDPPTDLTYGSEVSVFADAKMCMLAFADSALHNANADPDGEGSEDELVGEGREGYPCPFPAECVGLCVGSGRFEENHLAYVWSRSGRMSKCS